MPTVKWYDAGGVKHEKECTTPAEVTAWLEMLADAAIPAWVDPDPPASPTALAQAEEHYADTLRDAWLHGKSCPICSQHGEGPVCPAGEELIKANTLALRALERIDDEEHQAKAQKAPGPQLEPCGFCGGTGGVYHSMYDSHGRKCYDEPPCYPCEYCGGTGAVVDGCKLLPARPLEFYLRDERE